MNGNSSQDLNDTTDTTYIPASKLFAPGAPGDDGSSILHTISLLYQYVCEVQPGEYLTVVCTDNDFLIDQRHKIPLSNGEDGEIDMQAVASACTSLIEQYGYEELQLPLYLLADAGALLLGRVANNGEGGGIDLLLAPEDVEGQTTPELEHVVWKALALAAPVPERQYTFAISTTHTHQSHNVKNISMSWNEIVELFSTLEVGEKNGKYVVRGPCKDKTRNNANMKDGAALLFIDGDKGVDLDTGEIRDGHAPSLKDVCAVMDGLGLQYVAHTSHSTGKDDGAGPQYKWRVVLPVDEAMRFRWMENEEWLLMKFAEAGVPIMLVKEMKVMSQPWYTPRVAAEREDLFESYSSSKGNGGVALGEQHVLDADAGETFNGALRDSKNRQSKTFAGGAKGAESDDPLGDALLRLENVGKNEIVYPVPKTKGERTSHLAALKTFLSFLDPNVGFHDWFPIGMAMHRATGGSKSGFKVFLEWCRTGHLEGKCSGQGYRHSEHEPVAGKPGVKVRWQTWGEKIAESSGRSKGNRISAGSLIYLSREAQKELRARDMVEHIKGLLNVAKAKDMLTLEVWRGVLFAAGGSGGGLSASGLDECVGYIAKLSGVGGVGGATKASIRKDYLAYEASQKGRVAKASEDAAQEARAAEGAEGEDLLKLARSSRGAEFGEEIRGQMILPSNYFYPEQAGKEIGRILRLRKKLFTRGRSIVEVTKLSGGRVGLNDILKVEFSVLLNSEGEKTWMHVKNPKTGRLDLKPHKCTDATAAQLLKTKSLNQMLPKITSVVSCPILVEDKKSGKLKVLSTKGYHPESGGVFITKGSKTPVVPLEEAMESLRGILKGFSFQSDGDLSRALAELFKPALYMGGLLKCVIPIWFIEADQSQAGKGLLSITRRAIYNAPTYMITQKNGGV
ncbi:MAG TPA: hypothetical protein DDW55_09815, partial [Gammaproteobacteria bacterium]|nr:hypothetical protein [Gammaproteobacteria bacterium]